MKVTLKQKRFLIIWILFHSFALFVNLAEIYGKISSDTDISYHNFPTKIYNVSNESVFTSSSYNKHSGDFWPFTTFYETVHYYSGNDITNTFYFYGVFNSYGWPEYFFYITLGILIIYLPKLWNK